MKRVYLGQTVYLPPGQAWKVRVKVERGNPAKDNSSEIGAVVPTEEMLAVRLFVFQGCLWRGETELAMLLKN